MKRPGPLTASVVAMAVLSFIGIATAVFLLVTPRETGEVLTLVVLVVVGIAGIVDVVFLLTRKRWVFFYNLALLAITIVFFLRSIMVAILPRGQIPIAIGIFYLVLAGLGTWLFVDLIRRHVEMLAYLSDKTK
jgi:multidrug transporter EmrE-like cation transporter